MYYAPMNTPIGVSIRQDATTSATTTRGLQGGIDSRIHEPFFLAILWTWFVPIFSIRASQIRILYRFTNFVFLNSRTKKATSRRHKRHWGPLNKAKCSNPTPLEVFGDRLLALLAIFEKFLMHSYNYVGWIFPCTAPYISKWCILFDFISLFHKKC